MSGQQRRVCSSLLALLLAARCGCWSFALPGDLVVRGLLPLIVVAVGFAALAGAQRSVEFGVFAAGFFAVALVANLYDMANLCRLLPRSQCAGR